MADNSEFYAPPDGPPNLRPDPEIYARMGEDNIYRMVEDFYAELEQSAVREMFPEDMKAASRKNAAFLIGILGGPPRYQEQYGPPMMRRRHLPFAIDERARQTWLDCFKRVLRHATERYGFPPEHLPGFIGFLESFSAWMVNRR